MTIPDTSLLVCDAYCYCLGNLALSRALGDFEFKGNTKLRAEEQIVTGKHVENTPDQLSNVCVLQLILTLSASLCQQSTSSYCWHVTVSTDM